MSQRQKVETVSNPLEKFKGYAALLLVALGLVGFYALSKYGVYFQWGVLIFSLALAVLIFLLSFQGRAFVAYLKESVAEAKKVAWPQRKEATQITLYVFGFVLVMGIFMLLTDKSIEWVLYSLILGWK